MSEFTEKYEQLNLFEWINPFKTKFKNGILEGIENSPGVYRFFDSANNLLYVGKSIQLRTRILTYGRIQPDKHSKRLVRLASKINYLKIEYCENEEQSLLKENEYIRKYKPEFNRANTQHELYVFVGLKKSEDGIEIGWSLTEHSSTFDELFGAFKGLSSTYRMLMSIQRLQALRSGKSLYQKKWFIKRPPNKIECKITALKKEEIYSLLKNYFNGSCCPIYIWINNLTLTSKFEENVFNESLGEYIKWFQWQGIRNKAIREKFKFKNDLITQEGFDDWRVKI